MATAVGMPRLGMTMEEGVVVEWLVSPGGLVERGAPLLVIESEKAEVEIEATISGVLRHIFVEPGETVPCGTLLAAIADSADEPFDVCCSLIQPLTPDVEAQLEELGADNNMVLPWVVTPWGRAPWLHDGEDVADLDTKKLAMERFANKVIHR